MSIKVGRGENKLCGRRRWGLEAPHGGSWAELMDRRYGWKEASRERAAAAGALSPSGLSSAEVHRPWNMLGTTATV